MSRSGRRTLTSLYDQFNALYREISKCIGDQFRFAKAFSGLSNPGYIGHAHWVEFITASALSRPSPEAAHGEGRPKVRYGVEKTRYGFLRSHSLPFACSQFTFLAIPVLSISLIPIPAVFPLGYSHYHPIPKHAIA